MTRVIVDALLLSRLHNLNEPIELCNEAGQILARIELAAAPDEQREPQISNQELDRRSQSDQWYTTAEVLDHLGKLS